jgi:hypothetical protein
MWHSQSFQPSLNPRLREARVKTILHTRLQPTSLNPRRRVIKFNIILHSHTGDVVNLLLSMLVPMQDSKTVMCTAIQMPSFSALQVVFVSLISHQVIIIQSLN